MHVRFPNPAGRLVANAFMRIISDEKSPLETPVVPASALVRVDDGLQAWKIDAEGRVHPSYVEVDGEWNGLFRVVKGLSVGDRIVAKGAFKLKDGDIVKVMEP